MVVQWGHLEHPPSFTIFPFCKLEICPLHNHGKAFNEESALWCQAVKMLSAEWFEHRGTTTTEQLKELSAPAHVQGILNQISLNSDYEEKK